MHPCVVNVERDKHVERWLPRMREVQPDILLLQEFPPYLIARVRAELGLAHYYYENACFSNYADATLIGVVVFSRYPFTAVGSHILGERRTTTAVPRAYDAVNTHLVVASLDVEGKQLCVDTTHLPATKEGAVTEGQMRVVRDLLAAAQTYPSLVFAGDMNEPRGREAFDTIASAYIEAIPHHYASSIDGELHRAGPLPYMVDGLFHTPDVRVTDVELVSGLSDHLGVRGSVWV